MAPSPVKVTLCPDCPGESCIAGNAQMTRWERSFSMVVPPEQTLGMLDPEGFALRHLAQCLALAYAEIDGVQHWAPVDAPYEVHTVKRGDGVWYHAFYSGDRDPIGWAAECPTLDDVTVAQRAAALNRGTLSDG